MTGRAYAARNLSSIGQPSRVLLVVAALCLVSMPQSYRGGAELVHPHAIFQFWFNGGQAAAEHHHPGGDEEAGHDPDEAELTTQSPHENTQTIRTTSGNDVPTVSQMTTSAESSDAVGSVLGTWFVLVLAAATGAFVLRGLGPGVTPLPERPPPRFAIASL